MNSNQPYLVDLSVHTGAARLWLQTGKAVSDTQYSGKSEDHPWMAMHVT